MSLLIDTLSKIKGGKKGKPVPPNLKKDRKKDKKKVIILFLSIVLLSVATASLYVYQDKLLQEDKNILSEVKATNQEKPEKKPETPEKKSSSENIQQQITETIAEPKQKITEKTEKKQIKQEEHKPKPKKEEKPRKSPLYLYSTYISLGNKYLEKKDYIKSLSYYTKAYQINPSEKLLKNIIALQIYTGDKNSAINNLKKIKNPKNLSQILIFLIEKGEIDFVKDFIKKISVEDKTGYIYYTMGILEEKSGNIEKAYTNYKKAFLKNPDDPYIAYGYARILEIKGFTDKAYQVYLHINKNSNPDNNLKKIVNERIKLLGGSHE